MPARALLIAELIGPTTIKVKGTKTIKTHKGDKILRTDSCQNLLKIGSKYFCTQTTKSMGITVLV